MSVDLDHPREGCEDYHELLVEALKRRDELLMTIRQLSQQMPYEEEKGSTATLIAEVGTLKARVAELERERDELKKEIYDAELTASGHWDDGYTGD